MHASAFEAIMLTCFGAAWPVAVAKSYKSRSSKGKSLAFLLVIIIGYISGILYKLLSNPDYVTFLYGINILMVLADVGIYFRNKQIESIRAKAVEAKAVEAKAVEAKAVEAKAVEAMNPTRQLSPAPVSGDFAHQWGYMVGPFIGTLLAVGVAFLLRSSSGRDAQRPVLAKDDIEARY